MSDRNWYRNTMWSPDIAEQFRSRLQRSKNNVQYLRIQACILADKNPEVALALLDEYFAAKGDFALAQAYVDQATAYITLNNVLAAIEALEAALATEQTSPGLQTRAHLILPCLIAERKLNSHYARALDILEVHRSRLMFPIDRYQWNGARALILHEQGNMAEAAAAAKMALTAATESRSGFKYHRDLGTVEETSDEFGRRLKLVVRTKGWLSWLQKIWK